MSNSNDVMYDQLDPIYHHEPIMRRLKSIIQMHDDILDGMDK
jgi:hypothetical protein